MCGDRRGAIARAAWKDSPDFGSQRLRVGRILLVASLPVSDPSRGSGALVRQALPLGALQRILFNQDALPFIAFTRAAESHDHGAEPAGLFRAPGQGGVAGRQERKMVQIGAGQAERTAALHDEEAACAGTLAAAPGLQ